VNIFWWGIYGLVLAWSAILPKDYFTWALEVAPALIAAALLLATRHRFAFSPLVYWLILVHAVILMVGGHYTYAEVPLFDWLKDIMGWERNNFDKVGHFAQGFVPALVAREIILGLGVVQRQSWIDFFVVCICLAVSAAYELLEWAVAVASGDAADSFLGTQGYVWDTQSDMALALIGAICAVTFLKRLQDKQIARMTRR
jgi:putative membrane protein